MPLHVWPALGVSGNTVSDVLQDVFGFDDFRPGQLEVIEAVLGGRDCIAVMPTGAGKSLTYQLPARLLDGTVLVISPLISLMKDQVDALDGLGFRAVGINSTLSFEDRQMRLRALRAGEYELVYLAPEALDGRLRDFIEACPISLLVPLSGSSAWTMTSTSIDDPNAAFNRPARSSTSPTFTLLTKVTESSATVTASLRACLMAATAAHLSIRDSTLPPKIEPLGFESSGSTISVI